MLWQDAASCEHSYSKREPVELCGGVLPRHVLVKSMLMLMPIGCAMTIANYEYHRQR